MNEKLKDVVVQHKAEHGTTQRAIAKACAVPEFELSHWLKGRRRPTQDQLRRLCAYLGVKPKAIGYRVVREPVVRRID